MAIGLSAFGQVTNNISTNAVPPLLTYVYVIWNTPPAPTNVAGVAQYQFSTNSDPTIDVPLGNFSAWFSESNWLAYISGPTTVASVQTWATNSLNPFNAVNTNKQSDIQSLINRFNTVCDVDRPSLAASNAPNATLNQYVLDLDRLMNRLRPVVLNLYTNGYASGFSGQ